MAQRKHARRLSVAETARLNASLTTDVAKPPEQAVPLDQNARDDFLVSELTGPAQVFSSYGSAATQLMGNPFSTRVATDPLERHGSAYAAMRKMVTEDPVIASLDAMSTEAVLALPDKLEPAEGGQAEYDFTASWMDAHPDEWDGARRLILKAVGMGFTVAENIYEEANAPGFYWPRRVAERPQECFGYDLYGGLQLAVTVRGSAVKRGVVLPDAKFYSTTYRDNDLKPYGTGYLEWCFWPWVLKRAAQALWGDYLDRFAHGIIHGASDSGTDRASIDDFITNLGRKRGVVTDTKAIIKAISTRSGGGDVYQEFVSYCDERLSLAITGQVLMSMESEYGTRAQAETHAGTFGLRTVERARYCEYAAQLFLRSFLGANWTNPRVPIYTIDYQPAEDLAERIMVDEALWRMGVTVDPDYWYTVYGRPAPGTLASPGTHADTPGEDQPLTARLRAPLPERQPARPAAAPRLRMTARRAPTPERTSKVAPGAPALLRMAKSPAGRDLYLRKRAQADRAERLLNMAEERGRALAQPSLTQTKAAILGRFKDAGSAKRAATAMETLLKQPPVGWISAAHQASMVGYALSWFFRSRELETRGKYAFTDAELVEKAAGGYDTWGDVVDAYANKMPVDADTFYSADEAMRSQLWTVAGTKTTRTIERMRDLTARSIAEGWTWGDTVDAADELYQSLGLDPLKPWHLNQILRTNTAIAYGAGTEEWYSRPEVADMVESFLFVTAGDDAVRPNHEVLDGYTFDREVMDAQGLWAPIGFNCRCSNIGCLKGEGAPAPRLTLPPGGGPDTGPKGAPDLWRTDNRSKMGGLVTIFDSSWS